MNPTLGLSVIEDIETHYLSKINDLLYRTPEETARYLVWMWEGDHLRQHLRLPRDYDPETREFIIEEMTEKIKELKGVKDETPL
jgi:hypothetical protein